MKPDPFIIGQQPQRKKLMELTITVLEGPPPNLMVAVDPANLHPIKVQALVIDTLMIVTRKLQEVLNEQDRQKIKLAVVDNDKGLRNGDKPV